MGEGVFYYAINHFEFEMYLLARLHFRSPTFLKYAVKVFVHPQCC